VTEIPAVCPHPEAPGRLAKPNRRIFETMSPPPGLSYESRPGVSPTGGARIVAPFNQKLLPRDHFYRAAFAHIRSDGMQQPIEKVVRDLYGPGDEVTPIILRAATAPATTTTQGWASELAGTSVLDMLLGIGPAYASTALIPLVMSTEFPPGAASVTAPSMVVAAADAGGFVAEGEAIPVKQQNFLTSPVLQMRKMAVINVFTRDVYEKTRLPSVVPQVLNEAFGLLLDSKMLGTQTDDGVTPAGVLAGLSTEGATAGGGAGAVAGDVTKLVKKLGDNGGGRNVVFIAAPQQAAALKAWAGPKFDYPILASTAIADKTIVAIEAPSLVIAVSPEPEFYASREAVLHMENTTPAEIVSGAGVTANPVRSLYQTDCIALKTILRVNWAMRATNHVAFISAVTW
jgi:hypothetical protein